MRDDYDDEHILCPGKGFADDRSFGWIYAITTANVNPALAVYYGHDIYPNSSVGIELQLNKVHSISFLKVFSKKDFAGIVSVSWISLIDSGHIVSTFHDFFWIKNYLVFYKKIPHDSCMKFLCDLPVNSVRECERLVSTLCVRRTVRRGRLPGYVLIPRSHTKGWLSITFHESASRGQLQIFTSSISR